MLLRAPAFCGSESVHPRCIGSADCWVGVRRNILEVHKGGSCCNKTDLCSEGLGNASWLALLQCFLKALDHDISKRFVTKFKRIVRGPSFW